MKWVSFQIDGQPRFGLVIGEGVVDATLHSRGPFTSIRQALAAKALGSLGAELMRCQADHALESLVFEPTIPDADKILCIGRNYRAHIDELGAETPAAPRTFFKHHSALVGHGQPLVAPRASGCFDYEGELCAVIGKAGRHIPAERALEHVAGYTLMNDGSVRDFQRHATPTGKNFERSGSLGPIMVSSDAIRDPRALTLRTWLNGNKVQESGTDLLIYDIPSYIAYLSQWTTLLPGDVIATGTPGGVGQKREPPLWLKPGDTIDVEIVEIGRLSNPVVAE